MKTNKTAVGDIGDSKTDLGTCLFVLDGLGKARFGNVVDAHGGNICLSFAVENSGRRAEPEWFEAQDTLLATDIESRPPNENGLSIGYRYFIVETASSAQLIELLDASDESSFEVAPLHFVNGNFNKATPTRIQRCAVYLPRTLAIISRWRYAHPVDPLVDILLDFVGEASVLEGRAILTLQTISVPVKARATFHSYRAVFELEAHYQLAGAVLSAEAAVFSDEQLIPEPADSMPWRASVALSGGGTHQGADGYSGSLTVEPAVVDFVRQTGTVEVTREVYSGAPWKTWNRRLLYREPFPSDLLLQLGIPPAADSVQFAWRSHRIILYQPPFAEPIDGAGEHLAVIHVGPPLPANEKSALGTFIGYITGGRAVNVATETYEVVAGKLATQMHSRGSPTKRRSPPVPIDQPSPYIDPLVISSFGRLLDEMVGWRSADARSFDAAFHHYAEGVDSTYPVTRTLRLAVAFEAFINLVTQDFAENEPIMEEHFDTVRDALYGVLQQQRQPNGTLTTVQHERLRTKLTNLNAASNTRRQRAFWQKVPIVRSPEDDDLLRRLRNDSVHRGYVGDEQTREGLLAAAADADRMTDLFNRSVLTYAGYRGPVRSAVDNSWVDPIRGERFRVPPLPPNPTIQIEHTVNVPSMTPEEQTAYDALFARRRSAEDPHYIVDLTASWTG